MKKLTTAEEEIMQAIWRLPGGGFLKDIIEQLDDPKPHRNTVATLVKILVEKEFISIQNPNRNNFYTAAVTQEAYSKQRMDGLKNKFFGGSYKNVVSFLVKNKEMSIEDLEMLLNQFKKKNK